MRMIMFSFINQLLCFNSRPVIRTFHILPLYYILYIYIGSLLASSLVLFVVFLFSFPPPPQIKCFCQLSHKQRQWCLVYNSEKMPYQQATQGPQMWVWICLKKRPDREWSKLMKGTYTFVHQPWQLLQPLLETQHTLSPITHAEAVFQNYILNIYHHCHYLLCAYFL